MSQKRKNISILEDFIDAVTGKQKQVLYNFFSSRLIPGTVCCMQLDVKPHNGLFFIYFYSRELVWVLLHGPVSCNASLIHIHSRGTQRVHLMPVSFSSYPPSHHPPPSLL